MTSRWNALLRTAAQVANEVIAFNRHRVYVRCPGQAIEGVWHFRTDFRPTDDPGPWEVARYRGFYERLVEQGERAQNHPTATRNEVACGVPFRLVDGWEGCFVLVREQPFSKLEQHHLELVVHLLQDAAQSGSGWLDDLFLMFLDRRQALLHASSREVMKEYQEKARLLCLPERFDPLKSSQTPFSWIVRTTVKLPTPNESELYIASYFSTEPAEWEDERRRETRYPLPVAPYPSLAAKVYKDKRHYLTNDYQADPHPIVRLFPDNRSHLSAPIVAGQGNCLGVLSVETTQAGHFDERAGVALALLTAHMAMPLGQALEREQFEDKRTELGRVETTQKRIRAATEEAAVLRILEKGLVKLKYSRGMISRVDWDERMVIGQRSWGGSEMELVAGQTQRHFDQDASDCQVLAALTGQPQIVSKPWEDPRTNQTALVDGKLQAFGVFPLLNLYGEPVNTLHLERMDTEPLNDIDQRLVQALCRTAMERYETLAFRRYELEWVRELYGRPPRSLRQLLEAFAEFVIARGLAIRCRTYLIEADRQTGLSQRSRRPEFLAGQDPGEPPFEGFVLANSEAMHALLKETLQTVVRTRAGIARPIHGTDRRRVHPPNRIPHEKYLRNEQVEEWAEVPILEEGQLVAKVVLDNKGRTRQAFSSEVLQLFDRLARLLAFENERARREELRSFYCRVGTSAALIKHHIRRVIAGLLPDNQALSRLNDITEFMRNDRTIDRFLLSDELALAARWSYFMPEGGIKFRQRCEVDGHVVGQGRPLCVLLLSLFANSIDALHRATRAGDLTGPAFVEVVCEPQPGRKVRLAITDNGDGLTDEAFRRLQRPPQLAEAHAAGEGVGLPCARLLAQEMEWELTLAQRRPLTTFWLTLPYIPRDEGASRERT